VVSPPKDPTPSALERAFGEVSSDGDGQVEDAAGSTPAAARAVAVVRVALVVAVGVGAVIDDRPDLYHAAFFLTLAAMAAYASTALVLAVRLQRRPSYAYALVDLALLAALAHASGGAFSEVRFAFFAIPVLAAMLFGVRATAAICAAAVLTYLSLGLTRSSGGAAQEHQIVFVELVYLLWAAIAAVVLSRVLTRRSETIAGLARTRGRLMVEVLDAEDRERRRLANWLHDGAVQNLIVVGQDLAEAERGELTALGRAREVTRSTVSQLRNVLVDLHPGVAGGGLAPALQVMGEAQARQAGFAVDVTVEPGVEGVRDQLLLSVARELLINVAKHADAMKVELSVRRRERGVVLEIRDDGRGFDVARRADVVAEGHIGLASCAERVESVGGRLEIDSFPGRGTCVRAELPSF
jgi:two-component system NarL family sensor kinase